MHWKCGLCSSSLTPLGSLLEMQNLRPHPDLQPQMPLSIRAWTLLCCNESRLTPSPVTTFQTCLEVPIIKNQIKLLRKTHRRTKGSIDRAVDNVCRVWVTNLAIEGPTFTPVARMIDNLLFLCFLLYIHIHTHTYTHTHIHFFLFRAAPAACGSSQARGQIWAAAASLHHSHSNTGSEPHLRPIPQLVAMPNP